MDSASVRPALRPRGVLLVAAGVTLLASIENTVAPWAPFYVGYAVLCVWIPWKLGVARFGPLRAVRWWAWPLALLGGVLLQGLAGLLIGGLYPWILAQSGVPETSFTAPFYSFPAALNAMLATASARLGVDPGIVQPGYLAFIVLWAGLGEETFYRGYVHGTLARTHGAVLATLVSAALFAFRHSLQLLLLWPEYPYPAATVWVFLSFVLGLVFSVLYQRTGSLWLPVTVHYAFNVIPLLALASA